MTTITHPQLVACLVKAPVDIVFSLTPFTTDLWHGATGIAGEAGELLEGILIAITESKTEFDRVNIREELGDLYFYVEQVVQRANIFIDWNMADVLARRNVISLDNVLPNAAAVAVHGSQVLDTVKKAAIYNKALDVELLTNQMNALAVAMLTVCYQFGLSREECLNANIAKLSKRYESLSYSDKAAQDRADKVQPPEGIIPERKPFKGEEDTRAERAHTEGVTQACGSVGTATDVSNEYTGGQQLD